MRISAFTVAAAVVLLGQVGGDWRAVRQEARAAHQAKNYAKYSELLQQLRVKMNGHPSVVWAQAGADALLGNQKHAFLQLRLFADMGLLAPKGPDPDLA